MRNVRWFFCHGFAEGVGATSPAQLRLGTFLVRAPPVKARVAANGIDAIMCCSDTRQRTASTAFRFKHEAAHSSQLPAPSSRSESAWACTHMGGVSSNRRGSRLDRQNSADGRHRSAGNASNTQQVSSRDAFTTVCIGGFTAIDLQSGAQEGGSALRHANSAPSGTSQNFYMGGAGGSRVSLPPPPPPPPPPRPRS